MTQRAKHTLGEWYYRGSKANASHEIICDNNTIIACTGIWALEHREEQIANARLIAAAPDLLRALKNFMNGVETGAITSDHDEVMGNALVKAQEAIAKAGGN